MAAQRAIYALVMAAYPKLRTIPELAREIGSKRLTNRAVAVLVEDGILEQRETAYVATKIAIRCHRLDSW
ncbi:MAG TPA: hypothetical protein VFY48_01170 [Solirubrobacterales bacterium]|nr:hypothetical protein [Solirubrobacterales bacterium]